MFAVNKSVYSFVTNQTYECTCGSSMDHGGVTYRHVEVLKNVESKFDFVGIAVVQDITNRNWIGVATIDTDSGKVMCTNARLIGRNDINTVEEAIISLGY